LDFDTTPMTLLVPWTPQEIIQNTLKYFTFFIFQFS
jgi:hypothetical protein